MMPEWTTDRVKFPKCFDFYTHGNGFQIVRKDRSYSIIINSKFANRSSFRADPTKMKKWEMKDANGQIKKFKDIREAAYYIIRTEGFIPEVIDIQNFYDLEVKN